MKKLLVLSILIITSALPACKKKTASLPTGTYKGIVVFNICSQAMIQTLGPYYLGEETWVSGTAPGSTVYHHVFAVQNGCQFGNRSAGDTINFKVISPEVQNCIHCMMFVAVPDSAYAIQVVD